MKKESELREVLGYVFFILIVVGLLFATKTNMTGFAVYETQPSAKNWDFSNSSEYLYNSSLIEVTNGEAKLIPEISYTYWNTSYETSYYITQAIYDSQNKTEEIIALDNQRIDINHNNAFNLFFNENLDNGYIISLFLKNGSACEIYLCNNDTLCDFPGYGSVNFGGQEGFYNLTISGLNTQTNSFSLKSNKNYKIDYIKASNIAYEEHNSTNIDYPLTAEIETPDLEIENLSNFDLFDKEEILNNQTIDYYYSTDSGANWSNISDSENLSEIDTSSQKIKIKAVLNSDASNTPILKNIALTYLIQTINDADISNQTTQNETTNETASENGSSPNSGNGGGGGYYGIINENNAKEIAPEQPQEKEVYDVDVILYDNSFATKNNLEGEIINKGNKKIQKLNLELNPELMEIANIPSESIENLQPGEKRKFMLVEKPQNEGGGILTGVVTKSSGIKKTITGGLTFKIEENPSFKKDIPFNLEVLETQQVVDKTRINYAGIIGLGILLMIEAGFLLFKKMRNKKEKSK